MKHTGKVSGFRQMLLLAAVASVGLWTTSSSAGTSLQGGMLITFYKGPDFRVVVGQDYYKMYDCPPTVATPVDWGEKSPYFTRAPYQCNILQAIPR
ncbi:hypothetical protein [Luteimonas aquatica]|uniref:hypothetical protein n=1 Tax=Luteimonas aquatica TaxID=450364 RepID=UPI001F5A4069|nr:hypothetical protein [Luteimonas aquatica]